VKPGGKSGDAETRTFEMIGNVGFVGQINGLVYLCMSHEFAVYAVGEILGMEAAEVEREGAETIRDAIGEVTNMVAGGFKNSFCDLGHPCKLTLPTIVCGKELRVSCLKSSVRRVYDFDVKGHRLLVEVHFAAD
jgi:chemotaxis protein CheX